MSTVAIYTLEDFVRDLQQAFATHDDLVGRANAVAGTLQHLLQAGGWVREMLDKGGYDGLPGSTYVDAAHGHPAPGFHITCGAHPRGMSSGPHDHGASWVAYGTYEGAIEQTRMYWDYSEGRLQPRLTARESFVQRAGQVAYFLPGEIHNTRNVADDRSVVVRVEAQQMATVWRHRYDQESHTGTGYMAAR